MPDDQVGIILRKATQNAVEEKYQEAFELYLKAFKMLPNVRSHYETTFISVYKQLMSNFVQSKNHRDCFKIFQQARITYPDNTDILNIMGTVLLDNGCYLEAWKQFQAVLDADNSCACAEFYMNEVKHKLVHRWHYRMLNDKIRNFTYRKAIYETVSCNKDHVLDIGSGTSILAMYAAECSPLTVVGIESDKILHEISSYVLQDNNRNSIKTINDWSYKLSDVDIGGKKSLLITELFDAGLLGEGILQTLNHAFKHLLLENSRVLPCRAEFFVRGIKSDSLMKAYCLNDGTKALLNIPLIEHVLTSHSAYDCEDVHLYRDIQYMTPPQSLLTIDFNDPEDIERKLRSTEMFRAEFNPVMDGEVSTIIGYFNLHLTDNILLSLTTDPTSEDKATAWQQAIFSNFLPKEVVKNNPFTVNFQVHSGSKIDLIPENDRSLKISSYTMQFLNDNLYLESITKCVDIAYKYLKHGAGFNDILVADFSPFPLFGLMMLKRGAKLLHCLADSKEVKEFFEKVFKLNGIKKEHYKIIESVNVPLGKQKFHAVYLPMSTGRDIVLGTYIQNALRIKAFNLHDEGLLLPFKVTIMGQAIHSPWLNFVHRVKDDNVGYQIAHQMNKFQLSADYYINLNNFEYTVLTDPVALGVFGNMSSGIIECPVIRNGSANGILCWYDIELLENCGHITTKRENSFINSMVFLADPEVQLKIGVSADIICCVDQNYGFKFILDTDD